MEEFKSIHDFVKYLKLTKLFTQKQCLVIENLYIYFHDLKVYKVIVAVNPSMMKKAKRLGIDTNYKTTFFDDVEIRIDDKKMKNIDKGRFIAIYNPNNSECSIFKGEETEEEQEKKLKRPSYEF